MLRRMTHYTGPLLTRELLHAMRSALAADMSTFKLSLDLGRSESEITMNHAGFVYREQALPWPQALKDRAIHFWDGEAFRPLQRYSRSLIKLIPTEWGPPTFEIDGIKMLPTARVSPWIDAQNKVALIEPRGKRILDCCGGLGYFAACSLAEGAVNVLSVEKNADVLWLRQHNPWSPDPDSPACDGRLQLVHGDISEVIVGLPDQSVDAILHDPPRFGIAGDLYALRFYQQLARVLRPRGRMFHYTGAPNAKSSGRDVPNEVAKRLAQAGFTTQRALDGVYASRLA